MGKFMKKFENSNLAGLSIKDGKGVILVFFVSMAVRLLLFDYYYIKNHDCFFDFWDAYLYAHDAKLFVNLGVFGDPPYPGIFRTPLYIIFIAAVISALAFFTYKDASKQGMDPWMWMTIVVFLPNFIGLIIYLIVRKNLTYEKKCINCGKPVSGEFKLCPYCGAELNVRCPGCNREISSEWNVCPYCSMNLK
jgi:RNA polymerase subunit RPABC4/transcription elongation factor Spt4